MKKRYSVYIDETVYRTAIEVGLNVSKITENTLKRMIEAINGETSKIKSHRRVSNPRPADYESAALPAELRWHYFRKVGYRSSYLTFTLTFSIVPGTSW